MKLTDEQKRILTHIQGDGRGGILNKEPFAIAGELHDLNLVRIDTISQSAIPIGRGEWPTWAIEHFPTPGNLEEIGAWQPYTRYHAMHRQVLVVMQTRIEGSWRAYCGPVPGMSHKEELQPVLSLGDTVGEKLALCMFSEMKGIPYAL